MRLFIIAAALLVAMPSYAYDRYILKFSQNYHDRADEIADKYGLDIKKRFPRLRMFVAEQRFYDFDFKRLENLASIEIIERDKLNELALIPNDPWYSSSWHYEKINAPQAWDISTGQSVKVFILDTGVYEAHEDLAGKIGPGYNTVSNNSDISDINGHGTSTLGTTSANGNNGIGVTSIAYDALPAMVKVSNRSDGAAYTSDIVEGIEYALGQDADFISISYDMSNSSSIRNAAQQFNEQRDGLVVVSAGNSGTVQNYISSDYIVSVSATTSSDTTPSWSSMGAYVDVSAPGVGIYTLSHGGGYKSASGTSYSAPIVAGVLAAMRTVAPNLSGQKLAQILFNTAKDLGETGKDINYGHGRVDMFAAVSEAKAQDSAPPEPEPEPEPEPDPPECKWWKKWLGLC